jgi:Kef-type K+ transport system membrane component KefB
MTSSDSLALGALMNTRGLMELVVLNTGYDLGMLSPALYTMMIIMASTTTCMAGPVLGILGRRHARSEGELVNG